MNDKMFIGEYKILFCCLIIVISLNSINADSQKDTMVHLPDNMPVNPFDKFILKLKNFSDLNNMFKSKIVFNVSNSQPNLSISFETKSFFGAIFVLIMVVLVSSLVYVHCILKKIKLIYNQQSRSYKNENVENADSSEKNKNDVRNLINLNQLFDESNNSFKNVLNKNNIQECFNVQNSVSKITNNNSNGFENLNDSLSIILSINEGHLNVNGDSQKNSNNEFIHLKDITSLNKANIDLKRSLLNKEDELMANINANINALKNNSNYLEHKNSVLLNKSVNENEISNVLKSNKIKFIKPESTPNDKNDSSRNSYKIKLRSSAKSQL